MTFVGTFLCAVLVVLLLVGYEGHHFSCIAVEQFLLRDIFLHLHIVLPYLDIAQLARSIL